MDGTFHLWIDGVGGYKVCLNSRVALGQARPNHAVDVPLLADVSRLHATLTRDGESYLLQALRPTRVNGKTVDKALLRDGDLVMLGTNCELRFRQAVPVSASARFDLVSGHRFPSGIDAVLIMADTLVLGPGAQAHVEMPDLKQPMILFRRKLDLGLRAGGTVKIDGKNIRDRGSLGLGAHVVGDEFSLTLEAVP